MAPMKDIYVDQSAEALSLTIATGAVDLSWCTVLCDKAITIPSIGTVRACIIGASHFFMLVTDDGQVFTEVFACTAPPNNVPRLYCGPLRLLNGSRLELPVCDTLRYNQKVERTTWSNGILRANHFRGLVRSNRTCEAHIALEYVFPDSPERRPETQGWATTLVSGGHLHTEEDKTGFTLATLHAYPNEGVFVFTHSTITRR